MFGIFQQSNLRIEILASEHALRQSLLQSAKLRQWVFPQQFSAGLPEELHSGLTFTSWIGGIPVQHTVQQAEEGILRLLLSRGIDGYHEWRWGDGWVQSRIEGVSLLPLRLGQTIALSQLRQFLIPSHPETN